MTTTTNPAPIYFNLSAAQDALARSDEGATPLPGDRQLIDAYEGFCQQEQDRFERAQDEARLAGWLATQCPGCEDGGTGEQCDEHRPTVCPTCRLKPWDADDLQPGDLVCVCGDPFDDPEVAA